MTPIVYLIIAIAAFLLLYYVVPWTAGAYLRYRGKMLVTCPETRKPAAVSVDVAHAVLTAGLGKPDLRLSSCSRWPEREGCGQECLDQIEVAPQACMLRTIVSDFYKGKSCVYCGRRFEDIEWRSHKPSLMNPGGATIQWDQVRPEALPGVLATHSPVCWNCHVTQTFCREHPDLVIFDRRKAAGAQRR